MSTQVVAICRWSAGPGAPYRDGRPPREVLAALRERCVAAVYDDRMTARTRKADRERSFGAGTESVTVTSNEGAVTLAAWILARAHRERQL